METLFTSLSDDLLLCVSAVFFTVGLVSVGAVQWKLSRPRGNVVPPLSKADRAIEDAPVKHDGLAMHFLVPMERWCVTREDLKQFRRLVKNAVAEGRIVPTERDPFDPEEDFIGPCIHTVNSQFIMPVTQAAGGPSWALMKHPKGLPCDVFVTHGWAEGIYEFIDKVLNSWPGSWWHPVRNAYCCMLSNPQNLDISELCATPEASPFAQALAHASHMLVVPNQKSSIYTRVWCAYEAFMGYSRGKQMRTASSPVRDLGLKAIQTFFLEFVGHGVALALAATLRLLGWAGMDTVRALSFNISVPFAVMFLAFKGYTGSARLAFVRSVYVPIVGMCITSVAMSVPLNKPGTIPTFLILGGIHVSAAWALEADIAVAAQSNRKRDDLQRSFTGRLRDAKCSVAADGERIRWVLAQSGSEAKVNEAVAVLICMGTFSPRLREAVEMVGLLSNVSTYSYATVAIGVGCWMLFPVEHFTFHYCEKAWLSWVSWGFLLCWALAAVFLPHDCVAFAVASLLTLTIPIFVYGVDNLFDTGKDGRCLAEWGIACFSAPATLILTLLGPARAAKVPLVGPLLVRLLLTQSFRRQSATTAVEVAMAAEVTGDVRQQSTSAAEGTAEI